MSWIFVVVRDNSVEQTRYFKDFFNGQIFTDNFIKQIDPEFTSNNLPDYIKNEYYKKDNLTIGLYQSY